MKRIAVVVVILAVFGAAFWWFSLRAPQTPATPVVTAPQPDTKKAEREALFGAEAANAAIEWRESGLGYRIVSEGTPPKPGIGTPVRIAYVGRLKDGKVFDQSDKPSEFLIGATIPGLSMGLQMLGKGGKATFYIPPSLAYGNRKVLGIPPGSGLIFDVTVAAVNP